MSDAILIKGGTVLTLDANDSLRQADIFIRRGRLERIIERGNSAQQNFDQQEAQASFTEANPDLEIIDATRCAVLPGFVQTHIHLCQTIMRGAADDLRLIDWLRKRV